MALEDGWTRDQVILYNIDRFEAMLKEYRLDEDGRGKVELKLARLRAELERMRL